MWRNTKLIIYKILSRLNLLYFSCIKALFGSQSWSLGHLNGDYAVSFHKMVSAILLRRLGEHGLFPEVGTQVAIVLETTAKMTLAKLPRVALQPPTDVCQSAIPTSSSSCKGAEAVSVLLVAGMRHTRQSHSSLSPCMEQCGTCHSCSLCTGMMESLAKMLGPRW